jgi:hypothetical protein
MMSKTSMSKSDSLSKRKTSQASRKQHRSIEITTVEPMGKRVRRQACSLSTFDPIGSPATVEDATEHALFQQRLLDWQKQKQGVRTHCDGIALDIIDILQRNPNSMKLWADIVLEFGSFDAVVRVLQTLNPVYKDACFAMPWLEEL